jgi:hypothetical protein
MSMATAAFIGMGAIVLYGLIAVGISVLHHHKGDSKSRSTHAH